MKKAFKAFSPADKLYHINRMNSKLIHYSTIDNIFDENKNEILNGLKSLKEMLYCLNTPRDCKRFYDYLQSIEQLYNIISGNKSKDIKYLFSYMAGCFERFRYKYAKTINKLCEKEYHGICIPLFSLELKYKKAPNKKYTAYRN